MNSVVKKRITQLLIDKENEAMIHEHACAWLTNNVSAMEYVTKAGTFRSVDKFCALFFLYIEQHISFSHWFLVKKNS